MHIFFLDYLEHLDTRDIFINFIQAIPPTAQQSSLEPNPQAGRLSWRVRPADEEEVARILNLRFYIVDFNLNLFSFSFGEYYSLSKSWEDLLRSSLPGFLSGACCTTLNWLLNYYYYYY